MPAIVWFAGLLTCCQLVMAQSPSECAAQAEIHSSHRNPDLEGVARGSSAGLAMGAVVGSPAHGLLARAGLQSNDILITIGHTVAACMVCSKCGDHLVKLGHIDLLGRF